MSDHFSGPRALAGPAGDICDLYAFPSPERAGHLVLAMTVRPGATVADAFSDAVVCRFRLRPLAIAGRRPAFGPEEVSFEVAFDPPRPAGDATVQEGRCTSPTGAEVLVTAHEEKGAAGPGLRVFAGLRSDPFFLDLPAMQRSFETGTLAFTDPGRNTLTGLNVLGIVVETETAPLVERLGSSLLGVVAETVSAGNLPIRLERVGRPEIKNVLLSPQQFDEVNRDIDLRDLYNLEDAFHLGGDYRPAYTARLSANLAAFDRIDGVTAWPPTPDGHHPLTELLLDDYLVVDAARPFADDSYFAIEAALLAGDRSTSCGGRWLGDDVMDTIYGLLITGSRTPVSDGVGAPTVPPTRSFPHLAPPTRPGAQP
jgi:hypothetical protein